MNLSYRTSHAFLPEGRAQLWTENCVRCHNIRSPSTYSDAEWEVAMHHMRIRANLTTEEHRKILEFHEVGELTKHKSGTSVRDWKNGIVTLEGNWQRSNDEE